MYGGKRKLVGFDNFKRNNPHTDRFESQKFHHVEFWCADATNTARRFSQGLGIPIVAKSDNSTGNQKYCSYVLKQHSIVFVFTAPYGSVPMDPNSKAPIPHPNFDQKTCSAFFVKHGFAARAIAIQVSCAETAFNASVANGAVAVCAPQTLTDAHGSMVHAEVKMYDDVVLRFISSPSSSSSSSSSSSAAPSAAYSGVFMPHYVPVESPAVIDFGLIRMDHAVSNVHNLLDTVNYIANFTGWHEFAEFTAEDVGTVDSGLNSMVLANNSEMILLPVNEPTFGTKRKSQIQTFLEQNEGEGLQHFALKTDDIFKTIRLMRAQSNLAGFDFMPRPSEDYYRKLPQKIGNVLSAEDYKAVEELGLLVDRDDQGVLIQIFTKPLGDRMTCFVEIIQRLCLIQKPNEPELGGCGGFGKGNFSELFKSIEDYEKELESGPKRIKTMS